ncbi:MFS transporter [Paraburkholderia xenovorans]
MEITGTSALPEASLSQTSLRRIVLAGGIGTFIEYYDYSIYAFLATTLATLFFKDSGSLALLYTFAVLAVSYIFRPIGGIVVGLLGDRIGRKPALMLSVMGMIVATVLMGVLPTFATVGATAPIFLFVLRCLQALAAGGECGGAVTYVSEAAPDARRGALTSTTQIGLMAGTMAGSLAVAILNSLMSHDAILNGGWRIPFVISAPIGLLGYLVRSKMEETPEFAQLERENKVEKSPIVVAIRDHWAGILKVLFIATGAMAGYYMSFAYLVTYLQKQHIMSPSAAGWASTLSMLTATVTIYLWGSMSDRFGRRPMLLGITGCYIVLTYPLFLAMGQSATLATIALIILGLIESAMLATVFQTYCELFPTKVRSSGVNLGFNIAAIVGGGSVPYLSTWLIQTTGSPTSPAWILVGTSLMSFLVVAFTVKETANTPLRTQ